MARRFVNLWTNPQIKNPCKNSREITKSHPQKIQSLASRATRKILKFVAKIDAEALLDFGEI